MSTVLKDAFKMSAVTGRDPLPHLWVGQSSPVLDCPYLVKDLIAPQSLVVIYGASNTGKTFLALDIAAHVSSGEPWRGRPVRKGLVVYVAGEGMSGMHNRIAAAVNRGHLSRGAPFLIVQRAVNLLDPYGDVDALLSLVDIAQSDSGTNAALVVFDTLSRSIAGGDENSSEVMTRAIQSADEVRRRTGAAVLLPHHCGKDADRGARGHSSLRAAVDTEIMVEGQTGVRTATVVKQRDLPKGQVFPFELEPVEIGSDPDGSPVTSCVVKHRADGAVADQIRPPGKNQALALTLLRDWCRANPDRNQLSAIEFGDLLTTTGLPRQRKAELREYLIARGAIETVGNSDLKVHHDVAKSLNH